MTLAFDEVKATQTAARFLKLAGESVNYMALIKLLYKADREALRRWGLPITTDKYVSMAKGPVTSHIYDRITASANKNSHPTVWSSHIQKDADPLLVKMFPTLGIRNCPAPRKSSSQRSLWPMEQRTGSNWSTSLIEISPSGKIQELPVFP